MRRLTSLLIHAYWKTETEDSEGKASNATIYFESITTEHNIIGGTDEILSDILTICGGINFNVNRGTSYSTTASIDQLLTMVDGRVRRMLDGDKLLKMYKEDVLESWQTRAVDAVIDNRKRILGWDEGKWGQIVISYQD